jgi:hypothetical protein
MTSGIRPVDADPPVGVGCTTGKTPVDPTRPPRRVETSSGAGEAAGADEAAGVGCTTGAGLPVDPTCPPRRVETSSAGADEAAGVGCTTGAGLPVDPTSPPRRVERSSVIGDGVGVGCTTAEEATVGVGVSDVAGASRPEEPRMGSRGFFESADDCTGVGSASGSGVGVGVTITRGRPDDDAPRTGLDGTSSGSDLRSVDCPFELDRAGAGSSSSGVDATGADDARWFPVSG